MYWMQSRMYLHAEQRPTLCADSVYTRENASYNHFKREVWAHQKCWRPLLGMPRVFALLWWRQTLRIPHVPRSCLVSLLVTTQESRKRYRWIANVNDGTERGKGNKETNEQEFTGSDKRYISRKICVTTLKNVEEIWEMESLMKFISHINYSNIVDVQFSVKKVI